MEHEKDPETIKALEEAQKLRDQAGAEAKLRGECFEKSKKEFETGDKGKAKELSEEGKKHGALMEEFNKKAADAFFAANNKGRDDFSIDLHGLYVEEAVDRVKQRFAKIGRKGTLVIIWGAGNHSEGGVRKIKPAVLEILKEEKVEFDDDTPNHGCCTVYFSGKTAPAPAQTPAPAKTPSTVPAASTPKPSTGKAVMPLTTPEGAEEKKCCSCCCVM